MKRVVIIGGGLGAGVKQGQRKDGSIPLDFMRVMLWNLLPNGRSAKFYSIGPLRKKHPAWYLEDLTRLLDLLAQKKIRPVIARRMPLADARHAHELVEQGEVHGKIVLMVAETASSR